MRVIWQRRAEEDLAEAYFFLGDDSPHVAEALLEAIDRTEAVLRAFPRAGRSCELDSPRLIGLRSHSVVGFRAYRVFYRVDGDRIAIVRLLHGARDAGSLLDGGRERRGPGASGYPHTTSDDL